MQGITNAILCKRSANSDQTLRRPCRTGVQLMCPGHQRFGGRRTHDGIWQTSPLLAEPSPGRQAIIGAAGSLSGPVRSGRVRSGRSGLVRPDPLSRPEPRPEPSCRKSRYRPRHRKAGWLRRFPDRHNGRPRQSRYISFRLPPPR